MKKNKGFTLIELLVVIAIIGLLSTIVLVSLNSARNKAKDTRIKADIGQIRSVAELNADTSNTYVLAAPYTTQCNTLAADINAQVPANSATCAAGLYNADSSAYAVSAQLTGTGAYWCADSTGVSSAETAALGATAVVCP